MYLPNYFYFIDFETLKVVKTILRVSQIWYLFYKVYSKSYRYRVCLFGWIFDK